MGVVCCDFECNSQKKKELRKNLKMISLITTLDFECNWQKKKELKKNLNMISSITTFDCHWHTYHLLVWDHSWLLLLVRCEDKCIISLICTLNYFNINKINNWIHILQMGFWCILLNLSLWYIGYRSDADVGYMNLDLAFLTSSTCCFLLF